MARMNIDYDLLTWEGDILRLHFWTTAFEDLKRRGAVFMQTEGKQLAELGAMAASKAQVRVFSDDGKCVSDPLLMRRALAYVKSFDGVIAQHAQEPRLTENSQMNEGAV